MPESMRRQTARLKRSKLQRAQEGKARNQAFQLLQTNEKLSSIAARCSVSLTTLYRIRRAWKEKKQSLLHKLLSPVDYHAGRPSVLSTQEEEMIVKRVKHAAERGFAFDINHLKEAMSTIAADGRHSYKNALPCDDTIRSFRARHRDITYRKTENHCHRYFLGEDLEHVHTLVHHLKALKQKHSDLFQDPSRIWNLDETAVSADYGKRGRTFSASASNLGGRRHNIKDNGAHLTAVVIASASGLVAPPFFVASGKKVMPRWKTPIPSSAKVHLPASLRWLTENTWIPDGTHIALTTKGSMTMEIMPKLITHFNEFCRKFVTPDKPVLLLLDGHSSRKGAEWILYCHKYNIIVIQLPANTSHFLQPCDATINKKFKERTRQVRDVLIKTGMYSNANIAFKLKLGVAGFQVLTADVVQQSFISTGMWPMNFQFYEMLRERLSMEKRVPNENTEQHKELHMTLRTADVVIYSRIREIVEREDNATIGVALVEQTLQNNRSAHRVLWEAAPLQAPVCHMRSNMKSMSGAPAAVLSDVGVLKNVTNGGRAQRRSRTVKYVGPGKENMQLAGGDNVDGAGLWDATDDIPLLTLWRQERNEDGSLEEHNVAAAEAATALLGLSTR